VTSWWHKLTKEEKQSLVPSIEHHYAQGATADQLGEWLGGASPYIIRSILAENGIERRHGGSRQPGGCSYQFGGPPFVTPDTVPDWHERSHGEQEELAREIAARHLRGASCATLSARFKTSMTVITQILRDQQVTPPANTPGHNDSTAVDDSPPTKQSEKVQEKATIASRDPHAVTHAFFACATASRRYRSLLGWATVLSAECPSVALSVPPEWAGIHVAARHAENLIQRVTEAGISGPVIGWPDGDMVYLVTCRHPSGEPPEPEFNPDVVHVGTGGFVYLPPTHATNRQYAPLTWLHGPAGIDMPDCERLFAVIREVISREAETNRQEYGGNSCIEQ
jgi:hypothetical protein